MSARMSSTDSIVFFSVHIYKHRGRQRALYQDEKQNLDLGGGGGGGFTSRRQSWSVKRRIQRVPGMDLVLTTLYLPLGFHTSIEIGFAIFG
ncbi:hypothetical protein BHM03_00022512 [Ensete ventricosum]|nr:hypothetical protein BHM03_00022512 [Ensete ventricosum]